MAGILFPAFFILYRTVIAYTYILFSRTKDKFYIGDTSASVEERLEKHLQKHKGFTAAAKDWEIMYTEEYSRKEEAYSRERQKKAWKSLFGYLAA